MNHPRVLALVTGLALSMSLAVVGVSAQTESATAEDGKPATEAPATTTTGPSVPVGANPNLTPPVGLLPPALPINAPAGTGQSGASSVSMAPGTLTSGVANIGENAVVAPEASVPATTSSPATVPATAPDASAAPTCGDYATWYDAQLALESATDPAVISSLDPDGDAIACEALMYPEG